ncbi:MAG: type II secretion system protein, partial [Verrucomicrobiota bacterium]
MTRHPRKTGFTLIELLTVIAIIGVLAALVIPAANGVIKKANQTASASNMKQIATAYITMTSGSGLSSVPVSGDNAASSAGDWAEFVAENTDLNDGSLYFIP